MMRSSCNYSILLRSCAAVRRQTTAPVVRRFLISSSSTTSSSSSSSSSRTFITSTPPSSSSSSSSSSSRTSITSTSPSASAPTPTPSSTMLPKMMEVKEEYEKEKNKNSSSSSATETETEKKIGLMNYFKQLGMPFLAWWTGVWVVTGVGIYSGMELFGIDVLGMLQTTLPSNNYIDFSKVDPKTGNVMTAVAINELIEPIRFPFVLLTAKPIIKWWKDIKKKKQMKEQ